MSLSQRPLPQYGWTWFCAILTSFGPDANLGAHHFISHQQHKSRRLVVRALFPTIEAAAVAPEIFLGLHAGPGGEIIPHQRYRLGDGGGAHAVGPVAAE